MAFELPDLPYAYNALEPHIDERTMTIHHDLHHGGYVKKLNAALEGHADLASKSIEDLLKGLNDLPDAVRGGVRNNGGGHYNHTIFWATMSADGGGAPSGALADAINDAFGSFDAFKEAFTSAAGTRFGSGWAWLVKKADGSVAVTSTPNQDNPITDGDYPLLGLDVWEHAYYLNYQNRRPAYIEAFWNVVDWNAVAERF